MTSLVSNSQRLHPQEGDIYAYEGSNTRSIRRKRARFLEAAMMAMAMSKTTAATTGKRAQMLIDGSWVDSTSGEAISVESPGNRQIVASIPRGGAEDIDRAVQAAHKAFASWSRVIPRERGPNAAEDRGYRRGEGEESLPRSLPRW